MGRAYSRGYSGGGLHLPLRSAGHVGPQADGGYPGSGDRACAVHRRRPGASLRGRRPHRHWGVRADPGEVRYQQAQRHPMSFVLVSIHRSAWNRNSAKFTVANGSSTHRQALDNKPCCTPLASKRPDLVAVVAPLCIKWLRLATVQLPEKSWLFGPGLDRTSPLQSSRKSIFSNARSSPPIATPSLHPLRPTVPSIAADHKSSEPTSVDAVDRPAW